MCLVRGLSPVRTVLENGAVVLVQEATTSPAVAINARFSAGSLHDPEPLGGLAHLTGRTIDRGTERRPAERIAEELDDRGVSISVTTTRHTMSLACTCLSEDFREVLGIVLDVARRPVFPAVEVERRRAETVTKIRQDEDNPSVRAGEALVELLYGHGHPYGRRSKGTAETIGRIDREQLQAFHAARFQPSALSLAIAGDVRVEEVLAAVARETEDWEGERLAGDVVPVPDVPASRRERVIAMPGKSQTDVAYGFVAISRLDPRYYAYWIMNNILGQFGLGGRLADNIRERQGMAYYAFSTFDGNLGPTPLVVRAGVDPNNVERAVAAIDFEVGRLGEDGPTREEVDESRKFLVGSIPRLFETNHSIATFLQTSELFGLGIDYDRRLPDLLEAVTHDEIAAAASEVLRPDAAALAIAGPHAARGSSTEP